MAVASREPHPSVPRLALSVQEACEALGVSWDFWREHVEPDVRMVRRGRRKLVPVAELERWLEREAETVLGGERHGDTSPDASQILLHERDCGGAR